MSITLCEICFPDWRKFEVYCTIPLSPCVSCGKYSTNKAHLFPVDPREPISCMCFEVGQAISKLGMICNTIWDSKEAYDILMELYTTGYQNCALDIQELNNG